MASSIPSTDKQWNVVGQEGFQSLRFSEQALPEFGNSQVFSCDIVIPHGKYPWDVKPNVVPGSDGADTALAVGKDVTRFKPGDKIITVLSPEYVGGPVTDGITKFGLGGTASLSCAGVTAWNALFGLPGKRILPGQWVLTQGTGGVSLFAIQFTKAAGARVISTTSSAEKARILEALGVDHIINYRETVDWGVEAKRLTGGFSVDLVVEIAGAITLSQSLVSVNLDDTIVTTGYAGVRGVWAGSRMQMEEVCKAIDAHPDKLRPFIDSKAFKLEQLKDAYEYLASGQHQEKVGIEIK
ncbi:zinc-binding dehydrogenase [Colletotrichum somersetense]|nr:zinc-binding dehydrogenase [Colletotrichum somersetense]